MIIRILNSQTYSTRSLCVQNFYRNKEFSKNFSTNSSPSKLLQWENSSLTFLDRIFKFILRDPEKGLLHHRLTPSSWLKPAIVLLKRSKTLATRSQPYIQTLPRIPSTPPVRFPRPMFDKGWEKWGLQIAAISGYGLAPFPEMEGKLIFYRWVNNHVSVELCWCCRFCEIGGGYCCLFPLPPLGWW